MAAEGALTLVTGAAAAAAQSQMCGAATAEARVKRSNTQQQNVPKQIADQQHLRAVFKDGVCIFSGLAGIEAAICPKQQQKEK